VRPRPGRGLEAEQADPEGVPPTRPGTYHSSRGIGLGGRLPSKPSHDAQPPPVTLLSGAERVPDAIRTDDLPITSRMFGVGLDGSRRI
jgi:hypothetical protein